MELLHTNTVNTIQHITKQYTSSNTIKNFLKLSFNDWVQCLKEEKIPTEKLISVFNEVIQEISIEERYKDIEVVLYIL